MSESVLDSFEHAGLLQPRSDGVGAFYSASDEMRLRIVLKALDLGFTLADVVQMIAVVN